MTDIRVDISGPLFRAGFAEATIARLNDAAVGEVSSALLADWHTNLDQSIRNPTPYYETQLTQRRISPTMRQVSDRGVVYGPWLEGTSSRNRTTRFRGYSALRRARQAVEQRIPQLVRAAVARAVRELGG